MRRRRRYNVVLVFGYGCFRCSLVADGTHQCILRCVNMLALHEGVGVFSPMAQRVEMMRGVITIVEGETVALMGISQMSWRVKAGYTVHGLHTGTSIRVMLDR
jgi:hypothetical protein